MTTAERAGGIAAAANRVPAFSPVAAKDLLQLVALELGHAEALDHFLPYGTLETRAVAPTSILHIIAGNTPHAGFQSLARGLLLGSRNVCKLPAAGLPDLEFFIAALPSALGELVAVSNDVEADVRQAGVIVVFGGDETITHFRQVAPPGTPIVAHGHRVSFGVVFQGGDPAAAAAQAARDASLFDQQGCLSPHLFYVEEQSELFASLLAQEMAKFQGHTPRTRLAVAEAAQIMATRREAEFRASAGADVKLWASEDCSAWTVIWESNPRFRLSCLNRVVYVKPLPPNLAAAVAPVAGHLSTIGVSPLTSAHAESLAGLGASRLCPLGSMQQPRWLWHQDGGQNLAPLVRWIDIDL